MDETFYSVLDVDPEADTEAIRAAYREQAKTHHPDVSDDPDAVEQFKRITEARDVLVDATSRSQYDRVGHDAYVTQYLDSSAWSVSDDHTDGDTGPDASADDTTSGQSRGSPADSGAGDVGGETTGGSGTGPGGASAGGAGRRYGGWSTDDSRGGGAGSATGTGTATDSATAGNYERYKARGAAGAGAEAGTDTTGQSRSRSRSRTRRDGRDAGGQGWEARASATATDAHAGSTRRESADPRDQARADGWRTAHTAANAYTPSGRESVEPVTEPRSPVESLRSALTKVGPWLAFHLAFLVSAFVTVWLLMTWLPSITTMLVSFILLGCTVFFSVLHMISRVYA